MDLNHLSDIILGGGLVMALTRFIFSRLIHQVDRLADKVAQLDIHHTKLAEKVARLDDVEKDIDNAHTRLVRLETVLKASKH